MGLTVCEAPPHEVRPDEPLQPGPALEYYPGMHDPAIEMTPIVRLSIKYRNHAPYTGPDSEIMYGQLDVEGEKMADGQGWSFKFDNVCFKPESVDTVWSLMVCVYLEGVLKDEAVLSGILVATKLGK